MAEIRGIAPPVDAGRDPVATRAKWEAKAEALEAKRRERAERRRPALEGQLVATSASLGAVVSRSESSGSATGHSTPTSGSSQAIPASVAGS